MQEGWPLTIWLKDQYSRLPFEYEVKGIKYMNCWHTYVLEYTSQNV